MIGAVLLKVRLFILFVLIVIGVNSFEFQCGAEYEERGRRIGAERTHLQDEHGLAL